MNLTNKVALVTGGTRGIGAATAITLAGEGASIALVARRMDAAAEEVRSKILQARRRCRLIQADLSKAADATRCVEEAAAALGSVDVLIHSAGGSVPGGLLDLDPAQWYEAFEVHVHSIFHLCRAVVPQMQKRREGAIILISSAAGIRGIKTNIAYQAVKGTLPQLTRALAYELSEYNIRVNCAAPGVIRTDFHANMPPEVKRHNLEKRIPLHREGTAEEVAELIGHLIKNDYITGETVSIDGGLTMRIC